MAEEGWRVDVWWRHLGFTPFAITPLSLLSVSPMGPFSPHNLFWLGMEQALKNGTGGRKEGRKEKTGMKRMDEGKKIGNVL